MMSNFDDAIQSLNRAMDIAKEISTMIDQLPDKPASAETPELDLKLRVSILEAKVEHMHKAIIDLLANTRRH